MARKRSLTLTDGEHRIMEVLWRLGSATVGDVADALQGPDAPAYNTVLTMMRIMRDKGYLTCQKDGRAHTYTPKVDRDDAARTAVHQVLTKFFAGSPGELVLSFLRDEDLSPDELDELKRRIRASQSQNPPSRKTP